MPVLRTPDERFVNLPGYPFDPSYRNVDTSGLPPLRMHYVDAGPADGPVVVLLHGQPTWSYLYRDVITALGAAGMRVIDYTFARHIDWVYSLVVGLRLREITLVVQDWGGPIGLSVLAREPDRFAKVVATNTILHTCEPTLAGKLTWAHHGVGADRMLLQETLLDYISFYRRSPDITPSVFLDAVAGPLSAAVLAAYDAPFPDRAHKAGLRQLTALIPLTRNDPGARISASTMAALHQWDKPFLTAYSDSDPATAGWDAVFQDRIPGARGQHHTTIAGAGHFVQEQQGRRLADIIAEFVGASA